MTTWNINDNNEKAYDKQRTDMMKDIVSVLFLVS